MPDGPPAFRAFLVVGCAVVVASMGPSLKAELVRARAAECPVNLELIAEAQESIRAESGAYLSCPATPGEPPGEDARTWPAPPGCWARFGFLPDVALRGRYAVEVGTTGWRATCELDLDGDGDRALWVASSERTAARVPEFED